MNGKQHATIGTVGALGLTYVASTTQGVDLTAVGLTTVLAGAVIGSWAPDIDSKKSKGAQLFNKIFMGAIIAYAGLNFLGDVTGSHVFDLIMQSTRDSVLGNIGLLLFIATTIAGKLSPHRGFTHKWFGTLLFCGTAMMTFNSNFAFGFIVGYVLHLIADKTTKAGKHMNFLEFRLPCVDSKGKFNPVF